MRRLRDLSRALTPIGLTALRVVVGFIMAAHGWTKLVEYGAWEQMVAQLGIPAPGLFAALGMAAELAGGIGLMIGLLTPIAAFGVLVQMLVAVFVVHAGNGLWAENGGFEYPLVLAAAALFFLVRGAGPISVDAAIFRAKRERPREPTTPFGHEARV